MNKEKENNYICGNCKYYDSDECYCEVRCEVDLCEQDTCNDWEDDNEDELIDEEKKEIKRKRFIGIEIKREYIDMAKKRIKQVQPNLF